MADGAELLVDTAKLQADGDRLVRRYLSAGTIAVGGATKALERRLEEVTRVAVPGKLWRAWASDAYPRKGPARNPTGTVYLNGGTRTRGAMAFWTQPGTIRGREGQFLAIPLPAAGPRGRNRELTPVEWEAAHNIELRPVFRPGRAALLVADNAVLSGRRQIARANTAKRIAAGRGSMTVPIFVLIPLLKFRNTVAIAPIVNAADAMLVRDYLAQVAQIRAA